MAKEQGRSIDYRPALYSIRNTLELLVYLEMERNELMASNADRLNAAIDAVIDGIAEVAAAIRNPAVDNDQATLDAAAARLEELLPLLAASKFEEDAEDGGAAGTAEPVETPAE